MMIRTFCIFLLVLISCSDETIWDFSQCVSDENIRQEMLDAVNEARAGGRDCGDEEGYFDAAGPLTWNSTLEQAACLHARDMADNNYFSHDSLDGTEFYERIEELGYRYSFVGENLAAGQLTVSEAMAGLLDSPGHCANIMNPDFTELGSAVKKNEDADYYIYWAQEFGSPLE